MNFRRIPRVILFLALVTALTLMIGIGTASAATAQTSTPSKGNLCGDDLTGPPEGCDIGVVAGTVNSGDLPRTGVSAANMFGLVIAGWTLTVGGIALCRVGAKTDN